MINSAFEKKLVLPQYSATKGSDNVFTVHRLRLLCC